MLSFGELSFRASPVLRAGSPPVAFQPTRNLRERKKKRRLPHTRDDVLLCAPYSSSRVVRIPPCIPLLPRRGAAVRLLFMSPLVFYLGS